MFLDNTSAAGGASILTNKKRIKLYRINRETGAQRSVCLQNKLFRFCFSKTCLVDSFFMLIFSIMLEKNTNWESINMFSNSWKTSILENERDTMIVNIVILKVFWNLFCKTDMILETEEQQSHHGYLPKKNAKFSWLSKCNWTTEIDASLKFR